MIAGTFGKIVFEASMATQGQYSGTEVSTVDAADTFGFDD